MWLDIIKVKIPESFFFFLLLLLSWPRNKKSCCWSFRMSHVVKTTGDWKKAKKIYTQSPFTFSTVPEKSRTNVFEKVSFFFFLFFRRHLVLTTIRVLDRQNKLSLTKMKRLFGVKKTVEAPSLEETTGKVILLSSFRLLLCLLLLFSFLVAHPKLIIHLRVQHHKTNWIDIFIFILFFSLILNK